MIDPEQEPNTLSLAYIEGLYGDYLNNPEHTSQEWRQYFDQFAARPTQIGPSFSPGTLFRPPTRTEPAKENESVNLAPAALQDRVDTLIRSYRVRGHMLAHLDPLEIPRPPHPELEPAFYGLTEADMDRQFSAWTMSGPPVQTLRQMLQRLRNTYCREIGAQYMHIDEEGISYRGTFLVSPEGKVKIAEVHDNGIGRNASELVRKIQAAQFVASHPGEVCPAKWTPGAATLKPGLDLVGKV